MTTQSPKKSPARWRCWASRAKRVQLYTWNPARYSNLTNNPKKYMEAYKKAEEMTKLVEASYALLTAVLVPDDENAT